MRALILTLLLLPSAAVAPAGARVLTTVDAPLNPAAVPNLTGFGAGHLVAGPVLAGDRVVWAQEGASNSIVLRAMPVAGGAVKTLTTLPALAARDRHLLFSLSASPTRLAWFEGQDDGRARNPTPLQGRVVAGPVDGPFRTVGGCDRFGPACPAAESCSAADCPPPQGCIGTGATANSPRPYLQLTGDVVTFTDACGADGRPAAGLVRVVHRVDLAADPPATSTPLPAVTQAGALGPDLVADWSIGAPAVLRRVSDGASLGATPEQPTSVSVTAIQADGKFAGYMYNIGDLKEGIVWGAPGDPVAHPLPFRGTAPYDGIVAFAGDRVLVRPPEANPGLVLADLSGASAPVVRLGRATGPEHLAGVVAGASFDGTRVLWAVTSCEHTAIGISAVGDAPVDVAPRACDTPRIAPGARLHADRRGRIGVPVVCGRTCAGTLVVRFPGVDVKVAQRFHLRGAARFQRVTLTLPAKARRALRRGSHPARAQIAGVPFLAPTDLLVSRKR